MTSIISRLEGAKKRMWDAWSDYTEARREYERLERESSDQFHYDTLNVSGSDVFTAAKFDWKQSAVHVTASGLELRQNSGKNQLIKLAKSRLMNALRTAKNNTVDRARAAWNTRKEPNQ